MTPAVALASSMSSRSSTMSTISSTTSAMERPSSENTRSGCAPLLLMRTSSLTGTSGMSWPRYCTTGRSLEVSIVLGSISSSRVTSDSGTAFGCGEPARNSSIDSTSPSSGRAVESPSPRRGASRPHPTSFCAMPFGSMIMITEPSPRMVLPQNIGMCRSLLDIGFTTISSVWKTASTTMPKVWLPTCVTTMKPFSTSLSAAFVDLEQRAQPDSGSSLLRSRSTAASLMRSMRCSELARTRTSSTTASCGIAKRSPAHSHDQRGDDGERQRNLDDEAGALARART